MELLQGTLIGATALLPGVFSVMIALAPKARAIRPSGITTRVAGVVTFAVANWGIALFAYAKWCSDGNHGKHIGQLFFGEAKDQQSVVSALATFPPSLMCFLALLAATTILTGSSFAILQWIAITGTAIREFQLRCKTTIRKRPKKWLAYWFARVVVWPMAKCRVLPLLLPSGAGHWLVLKKAGELSRAGNEESDAEQLYADVLQGDEVIDDKVGMLYTGAVKQLVCETDGNIVFVVLTMARRWSKKKGWTSIAGSQVLAIEGESIRNISFRLFTPESVRDIPFDNLPPPPPPPPPPEPTMPGPTSPTPLAAPSPKMPMERRRGDRRSGGKK